MFIFDLLFSFPFLIGVALLFVIFSGWETETERPDFHLGWPIIAAGFVLIGLYMKGYIPLDSWITIATYIAIYASLGIAWSFFKWVVLLRKAKGIFNDFLEANKNNYPYEYSRLPWYFPAIKFADRDLAPTVDQARPRARDNKKRLTQWIIYWPSSVLWFLLYDSVTFIFNCLRGVYDQVAKAVF